MDVSSLLHSRCSRRALAGGGLAAAALTGALALGGCSSAAPAASSNSPAVLAASSSSASARITVTGTGTVTGTPNQLVLSMGVQVRGTSVSSALDSANSAVNRVTAALRSAGVPASKIQTSGLSIWPRYPNGSKVPDGYSVSESLTATLDNLKTAGGQITAAVRAGGNATTVNGISLKLTDNSSLLAAARAKAVADAKTKAAQYAKALGEPLGAVISISDQSSVQPLPQVAFSGAAASAGSSVPISPGRQQLSVSIKAVFAA